MFSVYSTVSVPRKSEDAPLLFPAIVIAALSAKLTTLEDHRAALEPGLGER